MRPRKVTLRGHLNDLRGYPESVLGELAHQALMATRSPTYPE